MSNKDQFTIDGRSFLHFFYNINSYEDMLNWIEDNSKLVTTTTKYRVVDYSFMLFNNKDIIISDQIVNIYINYYKQTKQELFDIFNEYIITSNNSYKLSKKKHKVHKNKQKIHEYIERHILTPSIIYDFLDMIKNNYNTIDINKYEFNPLIFMLDMLLKFIIARIK